MTKAKGTGKDLTKSESIAVHDDVEINNILLKRFNKGIIDEVDGEQIRDLLINPDDNQKTLENLAMYYYISNGDIFQQFDMTRVLPSLNYTIEALEVNNSMDKNINICNRFMRKLNHKELTRDLISQLISSGTVCGIWLGEGEDMYPIIFNDLEFFFPAKRVKGKWEVWCDLAYFDTLSELAREDMLESLDPYITKEDYKKYQENVDGYRYVGLPTDRGFALRTHVLKRNQYMGIPWVTTSLYDLSHKKTLKDLEKSVSNKIVNAIGVLTIGNADRPNSTIKKEIKKKIYSRTKEGLEKNEETGISLISLPEYVDLTFGKFDSSPLDPKKFTSINSDITNATGVSKGLTNGEGSYATAKINLDILYKKIAELLEVIESEVYNRAINLLLTKKKNTYYFEYEKNSPLSTKDQLDVYMSLMDRGYSITPILNMLGKDSKEYVEQSIREIEVWKLRDKIIPPSLSYTQSGKSDSAGNVEKTDSTNENTNKAKDYGSSITPRASE